MTEFKCDTSSEGNVSYGKKRSVFRLIKMRLFTIYYNRKAQKRYDAGDDEEAIRLYRKAIASDPTWSVPWYNLGLAHKYRCEWPDSYRANAEAMRLNPSDKGAIWNMGIAATALSDWKEARRAWLAFGLEVPGGDGPVEMSLGSVPIRINPEGDAEVVLAQRIDPARAVITSVPLPESRHACGDLILHDGAPVGYRKIGDTEVPVFNELSVLEPSSLSTFDVTIQVRTIDDLADFEQQCGEMGCAVEDWSNIRMLCRACSEGRPHEHGHLHQEPSVEGKHHFAIASPSLEIAEQAVSRWLSLRPHCTASEISLLSALEKDNGECQKLNTPGGQGG